MHTLRRHFRTCTALSAPYRALFVELRPCAALAPYVVCYWAAREGDGAAAVDSAGAKATISAEIPLWRAISECAPRREAPAMPEGRAGPLLVVPDACMDIMFYADAPPVFSGISDAPFLSRPDEGPRQRFCIRLPLWAVHLFTGADVRAGMDALDAYFDGWAGALGGALDACRTHAERARAADGFLLSRLLQARESPALLNAMHAILQSGGRIQAGEAAAQACISQRQLERLFARHMGVSIKRAASLVRYQNVWNDLLTRPDFDVQDAVFRYGFVDQPHLLRVFKQFHGMSMTQALRLARGEDAPGDSGRNPVPKETPDP